MWYLSLVTHAAFGLRSGEIGQAPLWRLPLTIPERDKPLSAKYIVYLALRVPVSDPLALHPVCWTRFELLGAFWCTFCQINESHYARLLALSNNLFDS